MISILNVAIGIAFVYLLLSLLVSTLNEIVLSLSFMDKRAVFLKEALEQLLQDKDKVTKLLNHGLVDALSRKTNGTPSYIGPEPFTAAVLDMVHPADPQGVRTIEDFKTSVAQMPVGKLKESLSAILDEANNNIAAFKTGVGCWYDRTMDRATGWYKRYTQTWLFWLSLTIAVACNVDTIHILQTLSTNPKLAADTADLAADYLKSHKQPSADNSSTPAPSPAPVVGAVASSSSSAGTATVSSTADASLNSLVTNVQTALGDIQTLRLPIGWDVSQRSYFWDKNGAHLNRIMTGIIGWFLTALAASLGAPFWFDTLQRFVNIRANGRSPDEKDIGTKKQSDGTNSNQ
jgi:hypothetical protein